MLTRTKVLEIPATLTVTGQGETVKFNLTFHNRSMDEVQAVLDDENQTVADAVLYIVKDWETEYPLTTEGLKELESDRPGMVVAVMTAFYDARRMTRAKNS